MKKWHWALLALVTLASIIVEFTMHHDPSHGHHFWSGIPMWWIWFGFGGCVLIIVFAKSILSKIIYKKEDYYNE